jgi:hypothetical protein
MRLSYLPPLIVYFATGVSGFTGIWSTSFGGRKRFSFTSVLP